MNYMYLDHLPSNKVLRLTKNGLDGLKQRLDVLNAERRALYERLRNVIEDPQTLSDLIAKENIKDIEKAEKEVIKITHVLQSARAVIQKKHPVRVDIGTTVILKDSAGTFCEYMIVCPLEVDLDAHKISDESPLGKLIINKKLHDIFSITNMKNKVTTYEIVEIK